MMQNTQLFMDPIASNTQRLVLRVQELEDLVVELKSKQSASDIVELKQLISHMEIDQRDLKQKINVLT